MQSSVRFLGYYKSEATVQAVYNDRPFSHTHVIGKAQSGKTTVLLNAALHDIERGEGILFLDPHGGAIKALLPRIPKKRLPDTTLLDFGDLAHPIGLNLLDQVPEERKPFVASLIVSLFKAAWGYADTPTPQMDQYLYNATAALLDVPDGTLLGIKFLLTSDSYRTEVLSFIKNEAIKDFWGNDFTDIPAKERRQSTLSTLNKIGSLLSDPATANTLGQPRMSFSVKDMMSDRNVLLVSIPQHKLGNEKVRLLGSFVLALVYLAATEKPSPFHVYLDRAELFGNALLEDMLATIGEYQVSLTLAHRYLGQLTSDVQRAVLGTTGTLLAFQTGPHDALTLEPEFDFRVNDPYTPFELTELPPYSAYARVDGRTHLLDIPDLPPIQHARSEKEVRTRSRDQHTAQRKKIEERLAKFIKNT